MGVQLVTVVCHGCLAGHAAGLTCNEQRVQAAVSEYFIAHGSVGHHVRVCL